MGLVKSSLMILSSRAGSFVPRNTVYHLRRSDYSVKYPLSIISEISVASAIGVPKYPSAPDTAHLQLNSKSAVSGLQSKMLFCRGFATNDSHNTCTSV